MNIKLCVIELLLKRNLEGFKGVEMTVDEEINEIKSRLPLPSEVEAEYLCIPFGIYGEIEGIPQFGQLTFERDIHEGIVIGWKLTKD